jgi:hypothetical protein
MPDIKTLEVTEAQPQPQPQPQTAPTAKRKVPPGSSTVVQGKRPAFRPSDRNTHKSKS